MKGVSEIEFIISVFVFITSVSFVTIIIINNIPLFHNKAFTDNLKAKSWQYSEILLFDEGYPKNWQAVQLADIKRIGFSSGFYIIDRTKLSQLNVLCSDPSIGYSKIKNLLGLDAVNDIVIEASNLDDTPVIGASKIICGPPVTTQLRPQSQITRLAVLNSGDMPVIRLKIIIL